VNAAFAGSLGDAVTFIHTDTNQAYDAEWIKKIHHFNAHYALRANLGIDGFKPFTKGFIAAHCASPVIVRRHHRPSVRAAMEAWWTEFQRHSARDQISLPYVIWRDSLNITLLDWDLRVSPWFNYHGHNTPKFKTGH
jgi:hypothetical protein